MRGVAFRCLGLPAIVACLAKGEGVSSVGLRPDAANAGAAAGRTSDQRSDVIYGTLHFADEQIYDTGNGNAYSGRGVFGALYDLQLCDDFTTTDRSNITQVTADYLCFFEESLPAGGLQVAVFEDLGGYPAEEGSRYSVTSTTVPVAAATSWTDAMFGLYGRRFTADVRIPLEAHTSYFLMVQAIDTTENGDWYYQIADLESRVGADRHLRDGPRGWWGMGWVGAQDSGYERGDVGMEIRAVPGAASAAILACWGLGLGRRHRRYPPGPC